MIEIVFTFVYFLCDLFAIGFGAKVLFWLLSGELLERAAVHFLRLVLATSIVGLLFPSHHLPYTHGISMLSVYVSGASILAWRKFHLTGIWYRIFSLSTTAILYLSVLVAIAQFRSISSPFLALVRVQPKPVFALMHYFVLASFAVLAMLAFRGRAKKTGTEERE
jgi:hypothetical protein